MASRIMHLIIANKVANELNITLKEFNFGNLLPDAHTKDISSKKRSHFFINGSKFEDNRQLDYESFARKYNNRISKPLLLGYFSHLVTDEIWVRDYYSKYVQVNSHKRKELFIKQYYDDYAKLNTILRSQYDIVLDLAKPTSIQIDEIINDKIQMVVEGLAADIKADYVFKSYNLDIFTLTEINNFIETASTEVKQKISLLM